MAGHTAEQNSLIIDSIILRSDSTNQSKDIVQAVSDVKIYESLLKPYLTGVMSFLDAEDIINEINYSGDEYVIISFKKYTSDTDVIKKIFYLDRIMNSKKLDGSNSAELYVFHLTEYTMFESSRFNISRSYKGPVTSIIKTVVEGYIPTVFNNFNPEEEQDRDIKVIIPNLTPMDAIMWLRKRALDTSGLPYFCFTTLAGGQYINCASLKQMLESGPVNRGYPFRNHQSTVQYNSLKSTETPIVDNEFQILEYRINDTENFFKMLLEGMVGSNINYFDLLNGENNKVIVNAEQLLSQAYDILNLRNISLYPYGAVIDNENIAASSTATRTRFPTTLPYETGYTQTKSFLGDKIGESYTKRVVAELLLRYLDKTKMTLSLPGSYFMNNSSIGFTIGNKISLEFLNPNQIIKEESPLDYKKTGDYLITQAVHIISKENYVINVEACKVNDVEEQT